MASPTDQDRLYFKQLLAGRDFAANDVIAQQMRNFAYLIGDRETGDCVVVDPAYAANDLLDALESDGMHLSGVLVSHHHPDHVGGSMMGFELKGLAELLERVSVPVHVNTHEADWVSRVTGIPMSDLTSHEHGDKVAVGDVEIELLHTPATPRAVSASSSTVGWSPVTPCSWRAADAPTSPAATSTTCTAACRRSRSCPAIRRSTPGTGIRPSRAPRCRRCDARTTSTGPAVWTSGGWRWAADARSELARRLATCAKFGAQRPRGAGSGALR